MAQTKTIQLLRSSSVYTSASNARSTVGAMTGQDGEIRIARYNAAAEGETEKIQSMLCIYHAAPQLPTGKPEGWTFIEDVSNNADSPAALKELIEDVIDGAGLNNDGSYTAKTDDEIVGDADSINATVEAIIEYLKGLDKSANVVSGQVVTTVTQANGQVSETKANLTDIVMAGYAADTTKTGAIAATDTLEQAFNKLENAVASTTVTNADGSIVVTPPTGNATTTDVNVNVDGTTITKDGTTGALGTTLSIYKYSAQETSSADSNAREIYQLQYGGNASKGTAIGDVIKVYKDSSLINVALGHVDDTLSGEDSSTHESSSSTIVSGTGSEALCFVYQLANGNYKLQAVNVESFLQESEFKDGLTVDSTNHQVSVKIGNGLEFDSTADADGNKPINVKVDTAANGNEFLSVSANGIKVSGVSTAITNAINALDVTTDAAVAGQYVAAIEQTDGVVAVKTRANVADAVLNGYSKGSSAPQSTAVAATDDVKTAISKLEWQITAANAGVDALDAEVTSNDGTNVQVKVTEVDGKITAVNVTTDNTINSTDLTDAIEELDADLDASGTAQHSGTFVMSGVTEVDGVITSVDSVEVEAAGAAAAAKSTIDAYTVNSKAISTNPVLNGSDIALTGYAKGADGTAVSASDSVNVAIGKLENQVDAAKAAATAAHTAVEHATGNTHVTVSASQPDSTTGKVTYTVNETNIADADDLTAEIAARKAVDGQSGDTYTANSSANYIGSATSLNNADVLLDGQVKTNADNILKNKISAADNSVTVTETNSTATGTTIGVKFAPSSSSNANSMITVESNGITLSNVWDCGTFA